MTVIGGNPDAKNLEIADDVHTDLTMDELNKMDERRLEALNDAGIDEHEVLKKAHKNLNNWNTFFNENTTRGKDDMNFCLRDQWTALERSEFNRLFKPAMTFNKLYDAIKKIAGEQRKNKPDLIVRSLTGHASQEQINLRADLVRTISYQSQNDLVYQTAFRSALLRGWGAIQLSIDYESPTSFNQIIKFLEINDPTRCSWDPTATKPHKGDGNFCARTYVLTKEEFAATFPYINDPQSYTDPRTLLDFQWETRDTIVVCDYYVKEWFSTLAYKLSNGMSVSKEKWEAMQDAFKVQKELAKDSPVVGEMLLKEIPHIVSKRQTQDYKIMHYRLIKDRIIEFVEWPSKFLPIIFVDGDSYYIEAQQYTRSFIHEARDAQKFINYVGSEIAAEIKNRRREQWLGTPDNIIGYEQLWRNPETQNGVLLAKPDPKTGQLPTKLPAWELSQGLLLQYQRGTEDIKEILGFYDASKGAPSNEQSGVAIANRQIASSMSEYVYRDNLNQAIEQCGRVVLDLLPVVYGEDERHVVIAKSDGKTQSFIINERLEDGTIRNSLEAGDYDIEIDTGPSFAVQKAAALQLFLGLVQANPQIFPLVADLIAGNLDLINMPQVKARLESIVPPEVLAKERGEPSPPKGPDPQQMMMQMAVEEKQQEMKIKEQQLMERAEELKIRQMKQQLEEAELALKARKLQDDMEMAKLKFGHEQHRTDLEFSSKIANVLAGLHQKETTHKAKSID